MADIRGVLLCAGLSTRFGGPKLMALARHGAPAREERVAVLAARHLLEGCGNALAVIRPGDGSLRYALEQEGCVILESPRSREGMGSSLADAVSATRDAAGWIVALGDMPFIAPKTVALVCAQIELGALLAAPVDAQGRRGHPVGFGSTLRDALLALRGDTGARLVVSRHHDELVPVPVDDSGIFIDIDTPQQLEADPESSADKRG
jgi:molybdenum cofactor cytidylyltransferase